MSNTTNSELDLTYAMPESIANVLGSAGFAEAARAFQYNNIGGAVPEAIRATLMMFDEDEQQLQAAIERASRDIVADAGNMNADSSVIAALALIGQSTSVSSVESARRKALDMIDAARDRLNNISDPDTPEERINRLWQRIDALTRQIDDVLDDVSTPAERARREAAADRLAQARENHRLAVESGDPVRIAATSRELTAAGENVTNVDRDVVTAATGDGRLSRETGNGVLRNIDDRSAGFQELGNAYENNYFRAEPRQVDAENSVNQNSTAQRENADLNISAATAAPDLNIPAPQAAAPDLNIPAPVNTAQAQGTPQQAGVAAAAPVPAEQLFAMADVSLGETGQFTPNSANQPVVSTGGRAV